LLSSFSFSQRYDILGEIGLFSSFPARKNGNAPKNILNSMLGRYHDQRRDALGTGGLEKEQIP